jgi:pimeloyl-ACP methyl ester carboxylesterase
VPRPELEAIAARLPAGEAEVMPALGHFGPFQAPATIAADIAGWAR